MTSSFERVSKKHLLQLNVCLVVALVALAVHAHGLKTKDMVKLSRDTSGHYKFTSPILDCENAQMEPSSIISESVEDKISDLSTQYGLSFYSVYYRDLYNGQWIGVNEKELFASASLVKMPILMSLYKMSETYPDIFDKRVTVFPADVSTTVTPYITTDRKTDVGSTYSMRDLSERMIEDSDNTATSALLRNVDTSYRSGVYEAIGVAFKDSDDELMISVKDYAGFFRVLFNATYLSREDSEDALGVLTKSKFDKGLVAGVPAGVAVAHKFGERSIYWNGMLSSRQLHDCGIVYYPGKPYIMCIMTRGMDFTKQEGFIRDVSKLFYEEVDGSGVL
ncbi:class A beta-lactamase-related serine hydrolase [Candidatus Parcubacteria bacterium]|nr:class A beta-lactamase-related serine hydrolase [Candidatus Parcubacteria bacterium]